MNKKAYWIILLFIFVMAGILTFETKSKTSSSVPTVNNEVKNIQEGISDNPLKDRKKGTN